MKNCVSIVLALLFICLSFTGCGKRETGAARDEKTDVSSSSSIETSSVVSVPEEPAPAGLDANVRRAVPKCMPQDFLPS